MKHFPKISGRRKCIFFQIEKLQQKYLKFFTKEKEKKLMKNLHLFLPLIFWRLELMTKIVSVTTMLEVKWTRHKKSLNICFILRQFNPL